MSTSDDAARNASELSLLEVGERGWTRDVGISNCRVWNLERSAGPLPKANQRAHLDENIDVFDLELHPREGECLSALNEHYSALGALPYV